MSAGGAPAWIAGSVDTPAGPVAAVATRWTPGERLEHLRCRLGAFRERYAVPPGLYAVGRPGPASEVLVTASYKLSFDHLRRAVAGLDVWILVLETRGVNVWCAAGKGTFGTEELARRVAAVGLERVVSHRRLVVPQLGAPGVSAHLVQRGTGFRVVYGPVRAADLPAFLAAGRRATPSMRRVRFGLVDRAVLVPIELVPALKPLAVFAAAVAALFVAGGREPGATASAAAIVGLGAAAVIGGAVLAPLLLPWLPGRAFAVKGLAVGVALTAAYVALVPALASGGRLLVAFAWAFVPAATSWLALQFTGATTFTSMSGVRKELRWATAGHVAAALVSAALLVAQRIVTWRGG